MEIGQIDEKMFQIYVSKLGRPKYLTHFSGFGLASPDRNFRTLPLCNSKIYLFLVILQLAPHKQLVGTI